MKYLDEWRNFGNVTAVNNIVAMETDIQSTIKSDFADLILAVLAADRANAASVIGVRGAAALLGPMILTYAKAINVPETNVQLIIDRLYQRFIDNALRVMSRQFTFGSPAAGGGNVGNGSLLRLNKDENDFDIEAQHADAKFAKCILDEIAGTPPHEEVFEFRDVWGGKDALEMELSGGAIRRIASLSARQSLLLNPSFSDFIGAAATPNDISNWTSNVAVAGTGADYVLDATNFYRGFAGDPGPFSLRIKLDRTLSQKASLRGTQLDPNTPYLFQVAYNAQVGAAVGDLIITIGSKSVTQTVTGQLGWNVLRVPSTPGKNCWLVNFNQPDVQVSIRFTGGGGFLLVDDVILSQYTGFDGGWYALVGSTTKWLRNDVFTWTDTAIESKLQRFFWRAFGRYLPHATGGAVTWTDPA